jgi:hypothetical protein
MRFSCFIGMHAWAGCKCTACGKTRYEGHDWSKDCEKCAKCGMVREDAHIWEGRTCKTCGFRKPPTPAEQFRERFITTLSKYEDRCYTIQEIRQCLSLSDVAGPYGYTVVVGGTREEAADFILRVLSQASAAYGTVLAANAIQTMGVYRTISIDGTRKEILNWAFECVLKTESTYYGSNQKMRTYWAYNTSGDHACMVAAYKDDLPRGASGLHYKEIPLVSLKDLFGTAKAVPTTEPS